MEKKISTEVATSDVERWLKEKKVSEAERKKNQAGIDVLVSCVEDGTVVIEDDFTITHNLKFPITSGDVPLTQVKYKPRLTVDDMESGLKGFDGTGMELQRWYANMLSGKAKAVFSKFDSADAKIYQAVVGFFL